jgi:glycosyltransferase involved in cell wall biosynthesis
MGAKPPLLDGDGGLVVVAYNFPPVSNGPAFILDRILGELELGDTVVFAGETYGYAGHAEETRRTVADVRHRDVPAWWPARDRDVRLGRVRLPLRSRTAGNLLVGARVAWEAARALRRPEARGLLAVYPKQSFLLAALLAAATSRKPLAVYFVDVYVEGLSRGRRVARVLEGAVARRASVVLAMSEPHREQLLDRLRSHGVAAPRVVEIPHPYAAPGPLPEAALDGDPAIVFTGAIYDAQAEALRRLVRALDRPELAGARLHLRSQLPPEIVAESGIEAGPRVTLAAASVEESLAAQRAADVLFLPIAFDANEAVRRTASPSKLPEYLAAGRPILVHAPPDAYVTRYAREHGFAEVVDVPDEAALAAAVRRLATDEALGAELVAAARETLRRHEAPAVAERFRAALAPVLSR